MWYAQEQQWLTGVFERQQSKDAVAAPWHIKVDQQACYQYDARQKGALKYVHGLDLDTKCPQKHPENHPEIHWNQLIHQVAK